jgi:hypothetical protein
MSRTKSIACAALALACLPLTARAQIPASADQAWTEVAQEWESTVFVEMVGASLALVYDGEIARFETSGRADIRTNAADGSGATGEDREVDEEGSDWGTGRDQAVPACPQPPNIQH